VEIGLRLIVSYLGQLTNVGVGMAMLPLLLYYLSKDEFLLWSLFTTIAGIFLQLETAVQSVIVRNLAEHSHKSNFSFQAALRNARVTYRRFAFSALILLFFSGVLYFSEIRLTQDRGMWLWPWALFCATYFVNYLLGYNNCVLISCENTNSFNINNMTSRITNISIMLLFFILGNRIGGIVISFSISVSLGCLLNYLSASKEQNRLEKLLPNNVDIFPYRKSSLTGISYISVFLALSYWLYRAILLIVVVKHSEVAPSYALGLQLFAIFVTLSLTPVQMRVVPLIRALNDGARRKAGLEFARIHCLVNAGIISCAGFLVIFSPIIERELPMNVAWPSRLLIAALAFAFFIEVNIQSVANVFVALKNYAFVKIYCASTLISGGVAFGLIFKTNTALPWVVLTVAVLQLMATAPFFFRLLRGSVELDWSVYREVIISSWGMLARVITSRKT
jgi:O-antigen/teichoic acid export membrane protein